MAVVCEVKQQPLLVCKHWFLAWTVLICTLSAIESSTTTTTLCPRIYTEGLDELTTGYVQYNGVYLLQDFTWDDFPVFKHEHHDLYLFYKSSSNAIMFGDSQEQGQGLGASTKPFDPLANDWLNTADPKYPLETILDKWFTINPYSGLYFLEQPSKIRLRCVAEDFQHCSSGKLFFNETVYQTLSDGRNITLNDPATYQYDLVPGLYRNARPVYLLKDSPFNGDMYLYHDRTYKEWVAGPNYDGHDVYFSAISSAFAPEYVVSLWRKFTGGKFVDIPTMAVKCIHDTREGTCDDGGDSNPCKNSATCIEVSASLVTCICTEGYTGPVCDEALPRCSPMSEDHGRSHAPQFMTGGNSPSQKTTFFCEEGYVPDYFLSNCELNNTGNSARWVDYGHCREEGYTTESVHVSEGSTSPDDVITTDVDIIAAANTIMNSYSQIYWIAFIIVTFAALFR